MRKSLIECALNIRKGDVTSTELVSNATKDIKKYASLNAFLRVDTPNALLRAKEVSKL